MESVTHSCGHTRKYRLNGPAHSVQRQIEHREAMPCPKCKKAQEEARFVAECETAALANAEMGLPELTGTASQVSYAEKCRKEAVMFARMKRTPMEEIIEAMSRPTQARWWIENKDLGMHEWLPTINDQFPAR
ncbi:MAG: hypothetical protein AB7E51_02515 [Pseudodesulfovibrio sp.]|uniref:hypothetical protein n=1 Tax=Pseudodesulfovibrio sp. TaxID=2035812 RepID=UPI003D11AB38